MREEGNALRQVFDALSEVSDVATGGEVATEACGESKGS